MLSNSCPATFDDEFVWLPTSMRDVCEPVSLHRRSWPNQEKTAHEKIILSIAALAALSASATPAMAQVRGNEVDYRVRLLEQQIERGIEHRTISRKEAWPLNGRLRELIKLERQYSRGGFTEAEQRTRRLRIRGWESRFKLPNPIGANPVNSGDERLGRPEAS